MCWIKMWKNMIKRCDGQLQRLKGSIALDVRLKFVMRSQLEKQELREEDMVYPMSVTPIFFYILTTIHRVNAFINKPLFY